MHRGARPARNHEGREQRAFYREHHRGCAARVVAVEAHALEAEDLPGEKHRAQDRLPFAATERDFSKLHAAQQRASGHDEHARSDDQERWHPPRSQRDGERHKDAGELREKCRRACGDVVLRVGLEQHSEPAEEPELEALPDFEPREAAPPRAEQREHDERREHHAVEKDERGVKPLGVSRRGECLSLHDGLCRREAQAPCGGRKREAEDGRARDAHRGKPCAACAAFFGRWALGVGRLARRRRVPDFDARRETGRPLRGAERPTPNAQRPTPKEEGRCSPRDPLRGEHGVVHEHRDRHRADSAGHGRDGAALRRDFRECDVAYEPAAFRR